MKKVLIVSSSLRTGSNSEAMAEAFARGARDAGNDVEFVTLRGKDIHFCVGCFSCQETGHCIFQDDAYRLEETMLSSDVLVFATPIYYYEMSGQLKTLLDRMNPLYIKEYQFRDVYFLSVAAEDEAHVPDRAVSGMEGWIACFPKASLKGSLFCGGVADKGEIEGHEVLTKAYALGRQV